MRADDDASLLSGRPPSAISYVLPLRRWSPGPLVEVTSYLTWLNGHAEVLVVDGSAPHLFASHRRAWAEIVQHLAVDPSVRGLNDKVNAVMTGVRAASHERVVIADDDVRYDTDSLHRVAAQLDRAHLVRPQNYFDPLPWHARWDTARTLVNRSVGHDFPGTLAVRRSALLGVGGYDADTLFENLELIRTIRAAGGIVCNCRSLYVRRLPPTAAGFWRQRVRQAYDSFAQPARLGLELALLPSMTALALRRPAAALAVGTVAPAAAAEIGRRRGGGTHVFPATASLLAPAWVAERAVCVWLALWLRVRRGGVRYAGATLRKAANSERRLRRRVARFAPLELEQDGQPAREQGASSQGRCTARRC